MFVHGRENISYERNCLTKVNESYEKLTSARRLLIFHLEKCASWDKERNQTTGNTMDSLPDEMLLKILGHFDIHTVHAVIAKVSPRWRKLAQSPCLNRHIKLERSEDFCIMRTWKTQRFISSVEIDLLTHSEKEFNKRIVYFAKHNPGLTHLTVTGSLTEETIANLSNSFQKLVYLKIMPMNGASAEFLKAIQSLETVFVNISADSAVVKWMIEHCTNLNTVHFNFGFSKSVSCQKINELLHARSDHLTKLSLTFFPGGTLKKISMCPNLRELRLSNCRHQLGPELKWLTSIKRLTVLHLTDMKVVNKRHFNMLINTLDVSCLIELNLNSAPFCDRNAKILAEKKPPLRKLELCNVKQLTPEALKCLAESLKFLRVLVTDVVLPQKINHFSIVQGSHNRQFNCHYL